MATSEGWDMPTGDLMKGKKGLIMGVANSSSIAWGIASQLAAQGAELAFTYLGDSLERRVRPLAESVGAKLLIPADVTDDASMDAAFAELEKTFGTIDFVVHSVAFANKDELKGSFVDNTTRDSFLLAMNISAFSFVDVSKRAAKLMPNGGSLITLTYLGSERVIPNYNTMGVAKAALEAATRYLAADLGEREIRVNTISAGPMRTIAARSIPGFDALSGPWVERACGLGLLAAVSIFGRRVQRSVYTKAEGQPGAAAWALDQLRSGWRVNQAVAATTSFDAVHRVVGRCGIVLVGEGQPHRLRPLMTQEKKKVARVVGDTPIYELIVGDDADAGADEHLAPGDLDRLVERGHVADVAIEQTGDAELLGERAHPLRAAHVHRHGPA